MLQFQGASELSFGGQKVTIKTPSFANDVKVFFPVILFFSLNYCRLACIYSFNFISHNTYKIYNTKEHGP